MADAPNANDELYPIAVLIDELKVCDEALKSSAAIIWLIGFMVG